MQNRTRVAATLVGIAAAAFGTAAPASAVTTPAAAAPVAPAQVPAASDGTSWTSPGRSLRVPAADVAAPALRAGARQVKVTTTRVVAGRPVITTATVPAERAVATVDAAQDAAGAVSVSVDTPVRLAGYNDPMVPQQWALKTLGGETFHARQSTAAVTVAVLDTGVDSTHPDLQGVLVPGAQFIGGGSGSSTGTGGYDGQGHGTHVAGIISGVANNATGVAGLTPGTRIMSVRVMDSNGVGWSSDIARGIVYAADHGAKVINMSLGGAIDPSVDRAVQYAASKGLVVVAAAGNERQQGNPVTYPAAYTNVIGVAATTQTNGSADFSNTGSYVDVAAPGVSIISTYPKAKMASGYAMMNGTSMATPYVAAAAAGLKAARPAITPGQVQQTLASTATDLGTAGRDNYFGSGLINPNKALCTIGACAASPLWYATTLSPTVNTYVKSSVVFRTQLGSPIAGGPVRVCYKQVSVATPACATRYTDSTGRVDTSFTARQITYVTASFLGNTAARATSTTRGFGTRFDLRVAGGYRKVTGTVSPRQSSTTLSKWDAVNRRWVAVRTAATSTTGGIGYTGITPGTYRVTVPHSATLGTTTSGSLTVS